MAELVKIYHPVTDEPFEVTKSKADDLRLNHGWRSQPVDPNAEPRVTTVEAERGSLNASDPEAANWRDSEIGKEVVEQKPRRRKSKS